jgi:hypothetical protein
MNLMRSVQRLGNQAQAVIIPLRGKSEIIRESNDRTGGRGGDGREGAAWGGGSASSISKAVQQPGYSASRHSPFSEQQGLQKVSEFPLKQIAVLKLHRQDDQKSVER